MNNRKASPISHLTLTSQIQGYFNGGQLILLQPSLLFGRYNSTIKVFSLLQRKIVGTIEHLDEEIHNFDLIRTRDNLFLYSFTSNGLFRKLEVIISEEKGLLETTQVQIFQQTGYLAQYMRIDPSNQFLIACDPEGNILLIDFLKCQLLRRLCLGFGFVKISVLKNQLCFLSKERRLFFYDLSKAQRSHSLGSEDQKQFVCFSFLGEDPQNVVLADSDGFFFGRKKDSKNKLEKIDGIQADGRISCMESLSIKGQKVLLIGTEKGSIYIMS